MLNGPSDLKSDLRGVKENGEPEVHERVDLRAWTALSVGGLADLLIRCRSADGLQRALDVLATHGRPWLVIGAGSRLVPPDRGLRIPLLNLSGTLGLWELDLDGAVAGGGANMAQVCRAAARSGLSGLNSLATTGSSVGGTVHAVSTGKLALPGILDWVEVARPGRGIERIRIVDSPAFGGGSGFDLTRGVVARSRLQLVGTVRPASEVGRPHHAFPRGQRPPRTAEPLFVDPPGARAEALLAAADCIDLSVGGARISPRRANRICTSKTARASDVLELTRTARDRVLKREKVELTPAMCFVDEDGQEIEL